MTELSREMVVATAKDMVAGTGYKHIAATCDSLMQEVRSQQRKGKLYKIADEYGFARDLLEWIRLHDNSQGSKIAKAVLMCLIEDFGIAPSEYCSVTGDI